MGPVNGVPGLEAHYRFPTPLLEHSLRRSRVNLVFGEQGMGIALQQPDRTGQIHLALVINDLNAGMLIFVGAVNVLSFVDLVVGVLFGQFHHTHKATGGGHLSESNCLPAAVLRLLLSLTG